MHRKVAAIWTTILAPDFFARLHLLLGDFVFSRAFHGRGRLLDFHFARDFFVAECKVFAAPLAIGLRLAASRAYAAGMLSKAIVEPIQKQLLCRSDSVSRGESLSRC
jgi:hypothetical protein